MYIYIYVSISCGPQCGRIQATADASEQKRETSAVPRPGKLHIFPGDTKTPAASLPICHLKLLKSSFGSVETLKILTHFMYIKSRVPEEKWKNLRAHCG